MVQRGESFGALTSPADVVPRRGWWLHWISVGCGLGLARYGQGTWGSLGAVPVGVALGWAARQWGWATGGWLFIALVVIAWGCIAWSERTWLGHDHPAIVVDEVVGGAIAFLPATSATSIVMAFLLFRVFDIWKPSLIGWIDRRPAGAWATLADDLLAGALTAGIVMVSYKLAPWVPQSWLHLLLRGGGHLLG